MSCLLISAVAAPCRDGSVAKIDESRTSRTAGRCALWPCRRMCIDSKLGGWLGGQLQQAVIGQRHRSLCGGVCAEWIIIAIISNSNYSLASLEFQVSQFTFLSSSCPVAQHSTNTHEEMTEFTISRHNGVDVFLILCLRTLATKLEINLRINSTTSTVMSFITATPLATWCTNNQLRLQLLSTGCLSYSCWESAVWVFTVIKPGRMHMLNPHSGLDKWSTISSGG